MEECKQERIEGRNMGGKKEDEWMMEASKQEVRKS